MHQTTGIYVIHKYPDSTKRFLHQNTVSSITKNRIYIRQCKSSKQSRLFGVLNVNLAVKRPELAGNKSLEIDFFSSITSLGRAEEVADSSTESVKVK